jgi:hypothetical protein
MRCQVSNCGELATDHVKVRVVDNAQFDIFNGFMWVCPEHNQVYGQCNPIHREEGDMPKKSKRGRRSKHRPNRGKHSVRRRKVARRKSAAPPVWQVWNSDERNYPTK